MNAPINGPLVGVSELQIGAFRDLVFVAIVGKDGVGGALRQEVDLDEAAAWKTINALITATLFVWPKMDLEALP